jgi:hypothetical protein
VLGVDAHLLPSSHGTTTALSEGGSAAVGDFTIR